MTRQRSGRRRALAIGATLLTLILTGPAVADERLPAGTPRLFPPGFVFGFQANLRNPEVLAKLGGRIASASRRDHDVAVALANAANAAQDGLPAASTDTIARFAAQSYAALADVVVAVQYLGLAAGRDPTLKGLVTQATTELKLFSGTAETIPLQAASLAHSNVMHLVDLEMARSAPLPDVTGFYSVDAAGHCPAMPRAVALQQTGYMVEAVADDRLVLFGAVGETRLHLAANTQRHARRRETADGPRFDVPDAPRPRFKAEIDAPGSPINLADDAGSDCMLTLTPAT